MPKQRERVRLFPGSTAGAPASQFASSLGRRLRCEHWKYLALDRSENRPIAIETRYRNAAHCVEHAPFAFMVFEVGSIRREVAKPELAQPSSDALADEVSHLAKSEPAQAELRQGVLKEMSALGDFHVPPASTTTERDLSAWYGSRMSASSPAAAKSSGESRLVSTTRVHPDAVSPMAITFRL